MIRIKPLFIGIASTIFFIINFGTPTILAQKRIYNTVSVESTAPIIDGLMNEAVWQNVNWSEEFIQSQPVDGGAPSQKTNFKVLYDENNLYVFIRANDLTPGEISKRVTRRDGPFEADRVGILLDSYFDKRTCFQFVVSAAGVKYDMVCTNDGTRDCDDSWNPIWDVEINIDKNGWTAEMRIPFNQLRFGKQSDKVWGLQVVRFIPRVQEWTTWQHIPRNSPGWVSFFGELHGLKGIESSYKAEFLPYFSNSYQTFKNQKDNPFNNGHLNKFNIGLNGKVMLKSNLTLDLTINPDFGQIEADPSEVNLTAFETRFSERRPFFVEGSNILNFSLPGSSIMESTDLFYTRRIGRSPHYYPNLSGNEYTNLPQRTAILGAIKLTGKTDQGLSIGILDAVTSKEVGEISLAGVKDREVIGEPLSNYFVGSIQKEFDKGTTIIGGLVTATNRKLDVDYLKYLNTAAYSGGLNFSHRWNERTFYFNLSSAFSHIKGSKNAMIRAQKSSTRYFQRPDAPHLQFDSNLTSLTGYGGSVSAGKSGGGNWLYNIRLNWRSPKFELNDLGFLRLADVMQEKIWVGYRIYKPIGIFRRISFAFEQLARWNFNGDHLLNEGYLQVQGQFVNYWDFSVRFYLRDSGLSTTILRGGPAMKFETSNNIVYSINTDERKKFFIAFDGYSYWEHDGFTQFHSFGIETLWRPINSISLAINPTYNIYKTDLQWVTGLSYFNNRRYLFSGLKNNEFRVVFRLNYNITPNLSIQYYGQPFISANKYSNYKKITNPRADNYEDRFQRFTTAEISADKITNEYLIDENHDGITDYGFGNPDFNFREFLSNLVVRWEYSQGSTLYFVWSQQRSGVNPIGDLELGNNTRELFDIYPHNIFMLKVSQWISW